MVVVRAEMEALGGCHTSLGSARNVHIMRSHILCTPDRAQQTSHTCMQADHSKTKSGRQRIEVVVKVAEVEIVAKED